MKSVEQLRKPKKTEEQQSEHKPEQSVDEKTTKRALNMLDQLRRLFNQKKR